jgi:hypothetical protein
MAARGLLSFALFLLSVVVVGGSVVAVGFGSLTHVSAGSAGALVLLGLVAVTAQAAESVRRRSPEVALARMRGYRGLRLIGFMTAEPGLVVLFGGACGVGAAWLLGGEIVRSWLPAGNHFRIGGDEWQAAGAVTLAALVVILATAWHAARTPLQAQLAVVRARRTGSTVSLFLQLILVVGAGVALYQAHQDARSRVDWVSLVSPAVVGLAMAQVLIWLLQALLVVVVPRSAGAALGWFLTLRRLLRRSDSLAVIRLVVAAAVVCGVAASASSAAQGWRDERARLQVGAPVSYPIRGGALRAYAAAHRADPAGRWLLPVAAYTTDKSQGARRVLVDTPRWKQVVGDFFAGTPSAPLTAALARFPATPSSVFTTGDSASVTIPSDSVPAAPGFVVTFQYVDDAGNLNSVDVHVRAGEARSTRGGLTTFTTTVRSCRLACGIVELDINGRAAPQQLLSDARFGGEDALSPASGFRIAHVRYRFLRVSRPPGGGLLLKAGGVHLYFGSTLGRYEGSGVQPVVATTRASFAHTDGRRSVPGVDGSDHLVRVVGRVPVLPFVGTSGSLLDLGTTLRGAGGSIPGTDAVVLARADTPSTVIHALLAQRGVGRPTSYDEERASLAKTPRALGTRLYLLIALFSALIALVALASGLIQQRGERQREAASLRSAGVRAREINAAYRTEVVLLGVATLVGTAVAAWISCAALIAALPLVSGWAFAPPLNSSPRLTWVLLCAGLAAVAVTLLGYLAYRRVGRMSAPRLLREELL